MSQFLHYAAAAKAMAIPQDFSKKSRAKKSKIFEDLLEIGRNNG